MITGKEDLLRTMMEVFVMEKGSRDFYERTAERAAAPEAKEAFQKLAGWESRHMDYIRHLYHALNDDRETLSFDAFAKGVRPEEVEGGIPVHEMAGGAGGADDFTYVDDLGAVDLALKMESSAYALYKRFAAEADDTDVGVFLADMAGMEQKHMEYLKGLRESIAKTS